MADKTLTDTSSGGPTDDTLGIPTGIPLDGSRAGNPADHDPATFDSLEEEASAASSVDVSDHDGTEAHDPAELDDIVSGGQTADSGDIDDPALATLLDGGHPEVDMGPDTSRFGDGSASAPEMDPFAEREGPGFLDRVGSVGAPFSADDFPGEHTTSGGSETPSPVVDDREGGLDGREGGLDDRKGGTDNREGGEDTREGGTDGRKGGTDNREGGEDTSAAAASTSSHSADAGLGTAVGAVINAEVSEAVLGDEATRVHEEAAREYLNGAGYEGVDQMSKLEVRRNIDFEAQRALVDGGSTKAPGSYTEDQWYGEGGEIDQARADLTALRPQQGPQDGTIDPADGEVTTFGDGAPPDRSGISNPSGEGRTDAPEVDNGPQDDVIDPVDDEGGLPVDGPWTDAPDIELDSGPIDAGIEYDPPPDRYAADQEPTETLDVE